MPPELGRMWEMQCLNTSLPSAYPAVCGIQHEAYYFKIKTKFIKNQ